MKATGLLCKMLSLPDGWDFSIAGLTNIVADGESAVRSALKELEDAGYFHREYVRDHGKIIDIEYVVYENREKPLVENPQLENQVVVNQGQLNTKELNTNNKKETYKEKFEAFYKAYPRKVGKANVEKWFTKNKPNDELFELIMRKLEMFKKSPDWFKDNGQFIPYPTTWLNQKRWEDEISVNGMNVFEEDYSVFKESTMSEEEYIRKSENGGKKYV
jgi:hypothetical protein